MSVVLASLSRQLSRERPSEICDSGTGSRRLPGIHGNRTRSDSWLGNLKRSAILRKCPLRQPGRLLGPLYFWMRVRLLGPGQITQGPRPAEEALGHTMDCQVFTAMAITEIGTGGVLTVVGMLVVFATLSVLGIVIALLSRWLKAGQQPAGRIAAGVDPRIIAVLTAAAAAAVTRPVRLTQIKLVDDPAPATKA